MINTIARPKHISALRRALTALVACAAFGVSLSAQAALIPVPNALAAVEGNTDNGFPFNITNFGQSSMRYQQVFDSSQFSALSGPSLLTQIAFRPDSGFGNAFATILPSIQINLSTTSAGPDALSTTFATNVGADDTIVHSGPLSLSSSDTPGPGNTRAFDILITLMTPFLYDPGLGDLLLDVRNFGGGLSTQFDAHLASDSISRVFTFNTGVGSPTGISQSTGLVAEFNFGSQAVPEPGTLALVALGLLIGLRRQLLR